MKTLQNNFTTPEQSNRLLELGVPADSADCCLRRILTDGGYCETWRVDVFDFIGQIHDDYLPCWSVGRLIEIRDICAKYYITHADFNGNYMENIIMSFYAIHATNGFDFSKLEE